MGRVAYYCCSRRESLGGGQVETVVQFKHGAGVRRGGCKGRAGVCAVVTQYNNIHN
jgi:hypothetical protein